MSCHNYTFVEWDLTWFNHCYAAWIKITRRVVFSDSKLEPEHLFLQTLYTLEHYNQCAPQQYQVLLILSYYIPLDSLSCVGMPDTTNDGQLQWVIRYDHHHCPYSMVENLFVLHVHLPKSSFSTCTMYLEGACLKQGKWCQSCNLVDIWWGGDAHALLERHSPVYSHDHRCGMSSCLQVDSTYSIKARKCLYQL